MIEVACLTCKKRLIRSPSKVEPRNFCSSECYAFTRNKELEEKGSKTRYTHGHRKNPKSHYRALARLLENDGHKLWKGDSVSYRGLHQWVRRKKGKPSGCVRCGRRSHKPKVIQWANIDGKYHRMLEDFVSLCASCHKNHDLALKSTRGAPIAIR